MKLASIVLSLSLSACLGARSLPPEFRTSEPVKLNRAHVARAQLVDLSRAERVNTFRVARTAEGYELITSRGLRTLTAQGEITRQVDFGRSVLHRVTASCDQCGLFAGSDLEALRLFSATGEEVGRLADIPPIFAFGDVDGDNVNELIIGLGQRKLVRAYDVRNATIKREYPIGEWVTDLTSRGRER